MAQSYIADVFILMEEWGMRDIVLPFLLIFTIVFSVLQKSNILGKGQRQFNSIIALIIALSVVIPHVTGSYPMGFDVIDIINMIIPQVSLVIVGLIMMLIMIGVFAPAASSFIAIAGAIIILFLLIGTTNYLYGLDWLYAIFGTHSVGMFVFALGVGLTILYITSPSEGTKMGEGFGKVMESIFKGGS